MTKTTRIRIDTVGGPDVMQFETVDLTPPNAGEVQIEHKAIGLNFIDTYKRSGLYAVELPSGLGEEAAGIVTAIGAGVTLKIGDRIAYSSAGGAGSYASHRNILADQAVLVPDNIPLETAAAMMLKGLTAQYLIRQIYPVQAGETVLFHAIAGGVGSIACQWLKHLGVTIIGTVGSAAKATQAHANGCDHTILYRQEDFLARVQEITGGKGVPVVFDSTGNDNFMQSLDCLQPRGLMVTFGNASGPVAPFSPGILAAKGSLIVTRPTLAHFIATPAALKAACEDLFAVIGSGVVKIQINQRYNLTDIAQAHQDLENRKTTGTTIIIP